MIKQKYRIKPRAMFTLFTFLVYFCLCCLAWPAKSSEPKQKPTSSGPNSIKENPVLCQTWQEAKNSERLDTPKPKLQQDLSQEPSDLYEMDLPPRETGQANILSTQGVASNLDPDPPHTDPIEAQETLLIIKSPAVVPSQATTPSLQSKDTSNRALKLKEPAAGQIISQRLNQSSGKGFPFGNLQTYERCYYESKIGPEKRSYSKGSLDYGRFYYKNNTCYRGIFTLEYPDKKVIEDNLMGRKGNYFYPIFAMRSVEDAQGKLVRVEKIAFYHEEGKARIIREILDPSFTEKYESKKNMDITMKVPPDTYSPMMFDYGYRVSKLKVGDITHVHMLSRQGMLVNIKIKVDEITEMQTPLKTFFCYKLVQIPFKMYLKHLKFFFRFPQPIQDSLMPKIVFYYSVDNPHRLVQYYGYKDFGPASLNFKQAGLLFEDYMDVRINKIEPKDTNMLPHSDFLLAQIDKYNPFRSQRDNEKVEQQPPARLKAGLPYAETGSAERCYYEATLNENKRLYSKGHIDYLMFDRHETTYHRAISTMVYPDKKVVDNIIMGKNGLYFSPIYYLHTIENQLGQLVRIEEIAFYPDQGKARILRKVIDPSFADKYEPKSDMDIEVEIPPDTYAPLMLDMGYRMADLTVGEETSINTITRHGILAKLRIRVEGIVEIKTPGKSYFCYKITQKPTKLSRKHQQSLVDLSRYYRKQFHPEITLHYAAEKPHRLVRYCEYSDFSPTSLNKKKKDLVSQGYAGTQLVSIETLKTKNLAGNDLVFDRMEKFGLLDNHLYGRKKTSFSYQPTANTN